MTTGLFSYPKRKLRKMVKNGDYREALAFGEGIEDRFASDPDFLFIMGSIYYILENGDNALHYFERALAINDSDVETLTLKAALHYARGEAPEARACCERALKVDPDHMASRDMLRDLDEVDEALAEMRNVAGEEEPSLDEAGRAAVEQGLQWAGRPVAAFDEAAIAEAYPEFKAQREMRERMARLVDRDMIAARFDKDTKSADEIIDDCTRRAWAAATSFWRGTGLDELDSLVETGILGNTKKYVGAYPFVGVSSDQAEGNDFGRDAVLLELDADTIRGSERVDAFRVLYLIHATVRKDTDFEEVLDTRTNQSGTLGYSARDFGMELETRLRLDTFPVSVVKRVYLTVDPGWNKRELEWLYDKYSKIAPVKFVPSGYHGTSFRTREDKVEAEYEAKG